MNRASAAFIDAREIAPPSGRLRRRDEPLDIDQLAAMWTARQKGDSGACARCESAHVALGIVGDVYRWGCLHCGWRSSWFRLFQGELQLVVRADSVFRRRATATVLGRTLTTEA